MCRRGEVGQPVRRPCCTQQKAMWERSRSVAVDNVKSSAVSGLSNGAGHSPFASHSYKSFLHLALCPDGLTPVDSIA